MPRAPKFRPVKTDKGWRINTPASVSASGKREQHFFRTRDEAYEARKRLLENYTAYGSASSIISPSLADEAFRASELLKPWNLSIVEAARIAIEIKEAEKASKPVDEACSAWLTERTPEISKATLRQYSRAYRQLSGAFGDRKLSSVTTEELQQVLSPPGTTPPSAKRNKHGARVFWFWAAEKGWCNPSVIQRVKVPKQQIKGEIEILSVAEAENIMKAAELYFPQSVPMFAVQLFAGVRAEEASRLRPDAFTEAGIEMSARITKKGRRRNIEPNEALQAWLEKYPFERCKNWLRVSSSVRFLAGFETYVYKNFIPEHIKPLVENTKPWPKNAMRHSYASYAVASGMPLESLLWQFGHTGTPAVLREHYVGRATKKDAEAFFAIRPAST